jgi:CRP-like cAMP-binding protein
MSSILELIEGGEVRQFETGQVIIDQGDRTNLLFFLIEGAVEVMKDGVTVATSSQPGAVFGELSALTIRRRSEPLSLALSTLSGTRASSSRPHPSFVCMFASWWRAGSTP